MTRSAVIPETVWVRKKELTDDGLFLILRVRANIHQVTVEDMDGESRTEYEYDEEEIKYQVPDGITTSAEIKTLLGTEEPNLIQTARRKGVQKSIYAESIEKLRETRKTIEKM